MKLTLTKTCVALALTFVSMQGEAQIRSKNRTYDGSQNNLSYSQWGAINIPLFRELPAQYGSSNPNGALNGTSRPNPRHISNRVSDEVEDILSARNLSGLAYIWGQFLDHDITRTPTSSSGETANITPPSYDPLFKFPIPFTRSAAHPGTGVSTPRQQTNMQTAWVDASQVYGVDINHANWLRTFRDGKLKTSAGNMLPYNTTDGEYDSPLDVTAPKMNDDNNRTKKTFVAGDPRVAENPGLTSLHTLFVREHNRICDSLKSRGLTSDEIMYQKARKEVGALMQAITYEQWLPTFGVLLTSYTGYKSTARPDITNIFSTAAYRWHTLVENDIILRNNQCNGVGPVELPLKNVFFNIDIVRKYDIGILLKGFSAHQSYETDIKVNNGLRNFLYGQGGLDLVALNVQRGRDHGLPSYNDIRRHYLGTTVSSFSSITTNSTLSSRLQTLYSSVNDIDAWVGLFSEDRVSGKSIGATVNAIMKRQFENLRDGDYYYYMNDPELVYDRTRIKATTLATVMARNSNAGDFASNVFFRKICTSSGDDLNDNGEPVCAGAACTVSSTCGSTSGVSLYPGTYTLSQLSALGIRNDDISKIKVNIGFAITVYEHDYFSGRSAYYGSNVECLPTEWDNAISSIKVICLSNDASTVNCAGFGGMLYDHCFSSGVPISVGTYTTAQLSQTTPNKTGVSIGDNTVSAIRVNNGFSITLYRDDNFGGSSITFNGPNVACLPDAWRNVTSSVKVTCLSQPNIDNCANGIAGGIFQHSASHEGITIGVGDYNAARLNAMGMPNKEISKIQVHNGFAITLFDGDNFTGSSVTYTETRTLVSWLNRAMSMKVTCITPYAKQLAKKDELALSAYAEADRARIEWVTNLGDKADYFVIEKFNGAIGNFEPIATVNAFKSASYEHYTDYDSNPQEGDNIYRIVISSQDGSKQISEPKVVNFKGLSDVRTFPNPANDIITVDLSNYKGTETEVALYNYLGQMLMSKQVDNTTNSMLELDVTNQKTGNYMIRIKSKGKKDITKSVIIAH